MKQFIRHHEYTLINSAISIMRDIMEDNTELVFDEKPISEFEGEYVIYSISKYNNVIMVNTILNSERARAAEQGREPKHETSTKGTESTNFILAVMLIITRRISYTEIHHPEWEGKEVQFVIG